VLRCVTLCYVALRYVALRCVMLCCVVLCSVNNCYSQNGILGMLHLLLETELTEEQRDYADTMKRSADSLLRIIDDVLDFRYLDGRGEKEIEM
jgi:His Kinase A (phospho-acceptor) domain